MSEDVLILLNTADKMAESVGSTTVISFLDKPTEIPDFKSNFIWVDNSLKINAERSIDTNNPNYFNLISYALVRYNDTLSDLQSNKVIAVFPNALIIYNVDKIKNKINIEQYTDIIDIDLFYSVLSLALEIAHDGREGRSIGTAFIIGEIEDLKRWSHQCVLNPYQGHPETYRNVRIRANWETIKEFSQLDGVFIIDKNGIIEAAGRYLDAYTQNIYLGSGIGCRHIATAAITKMVPSVGITVSQSGGLVRIFVNGLIIAEINADIQLF
ncbi:MAG TPA: diadenylate cyclase [Methanocorpusculum sp.]|nr:diadenylate cyclase [Methanocorpusculum sp.]